MKKNPYEIIKHIHITEKTTMLNSLKNNNSNNSIKKFNQSKHVFIVDKRANKHEIAAAVEEIYKSDGIVVESVNTINVNGKTRRYRGRLGTKPSFKKAIVTLKEGDEIQTVEV